MAHPDVIVVGGGIAGLATAERVARSGARVLVIEREPQVAMHASGRNAAIFRPIYTESGIVQAATRTRLLLDELVPGWYRPTGLVLVARDAMHFAGFVAAAERQGVAGSVEAGDGALAAPFLAGGPEWRALRMHDAGVMDIHEITTSLVRAARAAGATFRLGAGIRAVITSSGRVLGVELEGGERVEAGSVVIAAGAWAGEIGDTCGAPIALQPFRRHLAQVQVGMDVPADAPIVWRMDDEVYLRPESGAALASPCDVEPHPPGEPFVSAEAIANLADKLERLSTPLRPRAVRRSWACLRTFAVDRLPVVGPDPRVRGLHWCAGLGGLGMTVGLAAGEAAAAAVEGRGAAAIAGWDPARLIP